MVRPSRGRGRFRGQGGNRTANSTTPLRHRFTEQGLEIPLRRMPEPRIATPAPSMPPRSGSWLPSRAAGHPRAALTCICAGVAGTAMFHRLLAGFHRIRQLRNPRQRKPEENRRSRMSSTSRSRNPAAAAYRAPDHDDATHMPCPKCGQPITCTSSRHCPQPGSGRLPSPPGTRRKPSLHDRHRHRKTDRSGPLASRNHPPAPAPIRRRSKDAPIS